VSTDKPAYDPKQPCGHAVTTRSVPRVCIGCGETLTDKTAPPHECFVNFDQPIKTMSQDRRKAYMAISVPTERYVHVIEYAAYEQAVRERDELRASWKSYELELDEVRKGRDALREENATLKRVIDGYYEQPDARIKRDLLMEENARLKAELAAANTKIKDYKDDCEAR
jgi:hypothetical protein